MGEKSLFKHVEGPIRGVFSTEIDMKIGFGATRRTVKQNVLVFVNQEDDGRLAVQPINENGVPSGEISYITSRELLESYLPDPEAYQERVYPAMRELRKTVARGEKHRQRQELYSAEFEFKNALRIDDFNVRATFGLGLTYLDREEADKADIIFQRLVKMPTTFEVAHKHMFNEFGIKMRKNGMFDQALHFYAQAQRLTAADDHLIYNIARTLADAGKFEKARKYVLKAKELNPSLEEASKLLTFLDRRLRV